MERRIEPLSTEGRILAIDYGEKRIGLALSDPLRIFAKPFRVLQNLGFRQFIDELKPILQEQKVLLVVVGIPYAIEGGNTAKTDEVIEFRNALANGIEIPVQGWDERYSTDEAHQELEKMGYSWQEARNLVDAMAAAMILKSYLNLN